LVSVLIVVNGVLVTCTLAGGCFIAVQLLKKLRKGSEVQEHNEVSIALTETGSLVRVSSRQSLRSTDATGHVYETIE
jgi:cell division protein FtsX